MKLLWAKCLAKGYCSAEWDLHDWFRSLPDLKRQLSAQVPGRESGNLNYLMHLLMNPVGTSEFHLIPDDTVMKMVSSVGWLR